MSQVRCQSQNPAACRFHGSAAPVKVRLEAASRKAAIAKTPDDYLNASQEYNEVLRDYDATDEGLLEITKKLETLKDSNTAEKDNLEIRINRANLIRAEEASYSDKNFTGTYYSEKSMCLEYGMTRKEVWEMTHKPSARQMNENPGFSAPTVEVLHSRIQVQIAKQNYVKAKAEYEAKGGFLGGAKKRFKKAEDAYALEKIRNQAIESIQRF